MKSVVKNVLPAVLWSQLRKAKRAGIRGVRRMSESFGYNLARTSDYYSPLPTETEIIKNVQRWYRPSSMAGLDYDVDKLKKSFTRLVQSYKDDFERLPAFSESRNLGFGPGYTELDAFVLYGMLRDLTPQRYLEVGSGLSTYYCSLAAQDNVRRGGDEMRIRCIEPYPYEKLSTIHNIEVIEDEVQNVDKKKFLELQNDDVLFIDSSHVVKIDGDCAYLYLEVLPALNKGVVIHVHDIPFPYNVPFPPEQWVLGQTENAPYWPIYWTEAMLLQAFLAFNDSFEIIMSTPLIRHYDEQFLATAAPHYKSVHEEPNTFSSIWLRKTK
jgi:hypothetical protein